MLLNMSKPVEDAVVDNSQYTGNVKTLPASRYLDTTTVTFDSLRQCLRNSSDCLNRKFSTLREAFEDHFQSRFPMPSSRPLGEIVQQNASRTATLIGDLNDLLIISETSVTHSLCFTNFRSLNNFASRAQLHNLNG